jgi:response regulator RpfG family c-di-GMP phosphodiesterase
MAKQIMIVDDDRNILEFMNLALTFEGYDVRVSTTGKDLQQVLQPGDLPDLILLDVKLTDEDGRAICKQHLMSPVRLNALYGYCFASSCLTISRAFSRVTPELSKIWLASPSSRRSRPSNRCSVPR